MRRELCRIFERPPRCAATCKRGAARSAPRSCSLDGRGGPRLARARDGMLASAGELDEARRPGTREALVLATSSERDAALRHAACDSRHVSSFDAGDFARARVRLDRARSARWSRTLLGAHGLAVLGTHWQETSRSPRSATSAARRSARERCSAARQRAAAQRAASSELLQEIAAASHRTSCRRRQRSSAPSERLQREVRRAAAGSRADHERRPPRRCEPSSVTERFEREPAPRDAARPRTRLLSLAARCLD